MFFLNDIDKLPLIIFGGDFNLPHMYNSKYNPIKEERLMIDYLQTICFRSGINLTREKSSGNHAANSCSIFARTSLLVYYE